MTFNLQEVARAIGAEENPAPAPVSGWSVETGRQSVVALSCALRGPNHDGHDFVAAALAKDAVGVVVDVPGFLADGPVVLEVSDTLRALQELGRWARRQWGGQVVGVTGSAGKTTTKDAIAHLLAVEMPVGKTVGNLNNHVGVPLSILRLPDGCRAAAGRLPRGCLGDGDESC